jgi:hypothetical protein
MSKSKRSNKYIENRGNRPSGSLGVFTWSILQVVSTLGWPGAFVVISIWAIHNWATIEQKHSLIDKYILFNWNGNYWCIIGPSLAISMIFLAQNYYFRKKVSLKDEEIKRLTEERNKLQEELSQKKFHSSEGE